MAQGKCFLCYSQQTFIRASYELSAVLGTGEALFRWVSTIPFLENFSQKFGLHAKARQQWARVVLG